LVRPAYRALKAPFLYLCARGSGRTRTPPPRRMDRGSG
jgi:hypothetical protein